MSASFPVVPARWLAAALLVCSLAALTQPGGCAARNLHKRSFVELGCRGNFEQSYLARLERVCEECYQLYREPEVYNLCRCNAVEAVEEVRSARYVKSARVALGFRRRKRGLRDCLRLCAAGTNRGGHDTGSCFKNENFDLCADALLLKGEMTDLRRMINYVYG